MQRWGLQWIGQGDLVEADQGRPRSRQGSAELEGELRRIIGAVAFLEVPAEALFAWPELDLRGRTGATVLAIRREGASIPNPEATERLREGDVLALTGTADALDAARAALVD